VTPEEFAESKVIILDLLGWGVPSEYFLDCGLSRESIYYAFTELNLRLVTPNSSFSSYTHNLTRLPSNISTEGIIPFIPPTHDTTSSVISTTSKARTDGSLAASQRPANAQLNGAQRLQSETVPHPIKVPVPLAPSQHPLPPRPTAAASFATANEPKSAANLMTEVPATTTNSTASSKRSLSPSDPIPGLQGQHSSARPQEVQRPQVAALDTQASTYTRPLDEIETLRRQELLARKAVLASRKPKSQVKDVTPVPPPPSKPPPPIPAESVDDFLKSIASTTVTTEAAKTLVTGSKRSTKSPDTMDVDSDAIPIAGPSVTGRSASWSNPQAPQSPAFDRPAPSRKNTLKRPVASDFVDYDTSSRGSPAPPPFGFKPPLFSGPSFANITSSRKLVIDFSDSEDEVMEDATTQPQDGPSIQLPGSNSTGTSTPEPAQIPGLSPAFINITPDALALKEQEIKRMKQLIAERERDRQKKLANMVRWTTLASG